MSESATMIKPGDSTSGRLTPVENVRAMLEARRGELGRALPRHLSADRLLRVVLTAITKTPRLMECTQASLYNAVLQAAQLGLEPDGALGQGYLIPYRNNKKGVIEARFQPGYRGLLALAWNSEQIAGVVAECVYEGDEFRFRMGLNPVLEHVPSGETDSAKITHAYAVITTKNGGKVFKVLNRKQIDAVASSSSNNDPDSPWRTDFPPMAEKTVLIRALKLAPVSIEVRGALEPAAEIGETWAGMARTIEMPVSQVAGITQSQPTQKLIEPQQVIDHGPATIESERESALEELGRAAEGLTDVQVRAILAEIGLTPDGLKNSDPSAIQEAARIAKKIKKAKGIAK